MFKNKYLVPFILVTMLFFLWAFLHNINPILIPHLKKACQLNDTQSSFIDSSVYLAYFLIAIPAGLAMRRYGYKKAIIIGLCLYAAGALLVLPAVSTRSYSFFLFAFFVIASGATFLETAANPYITVLGNPDSAAQRLNLAQSFNGIGAFLAPILGGKFILTGVEYSKAEISKLSASGSLGNYLQLEANTVKMPYLVIAGAVIALIILFVFTKIPDGNKSGEIEEPNDLHPKFSFRILKHRHLAWAVIAQFFYVGAQVGVGSFFIRYARFTAGMNEKNAAYLFGTVAMVGFMAGRFTGTFLMRYINPVRLLSVYAIINIVLLFIAILTKGDTALYALVAVPFFMSIMYPTIFALGIKNLGEETKIAASFLVMAIIGGAVAPLAMGLISDKTGSIQVAYAVPLVCFVVVLYFSLFGYKTKISKQESVLAPVEAVLVTAG